MKIFAHRGYSGKYPENTILAFKKALDIGVDGIELDVHKSKDGKLVVIHDEDIKRTFNGGGLIKDYTLEELQAFKSKELNFSNNEECKICTLEDVIELIENENITLNIEAKTDNIHYDLEEDVINLIRKYNIEEKILISSFYHNTIRNFKNIDDNINYGALYWCEKDYANEQDIVEHAKKIGVYSINISTELANKDMVKKAHENNLKVFVYTVNSEKAMKDMIDYKVDGIFTDFPELMKGILKSNKIYL